MRFGAYFLLALVAFAISHVGGDLYASVRIAGETPQAAWANYSRYAGLGGEAFLFSPFLLVAVLCGWFASRARTRSVAAIFAAATAALAYLYVDGHRSAEAAMQEEMWTAAALSVGLLPFVGSVIGLVTALAGFLAIRFDTRTPED